MDEPVDIQRFYKHCFTLFAVFIYKTDTGHKNSSILLIHWFELRIFCFLFFNQLSSKACKITDKYQCNIVFARISRHFIYFWQIYMRFQFFAKIYKTSTDAVIQFAFVNIAFLNKKVTVSHFSKSFFAIFHIISLICM